VVTAEAVRDGAVRLDQSAPGWWGEPMPDGSDGWDLAYAAALRSGWQRRGRGLYGLRRFKPARAEWVYAYYSRRLVAAAADGLDESWPGWFAYGHYPQRRPVIGWPFADAVHNRLDATVLDPSLRAVWWHEARRRPLTGPVDRLLATQW
jgi:hypothetical protein